MNERPVRFGVNLNNRGPLIYPGLVRPADLIEMGREAERLGFDSVWAGDNLFSRYRYEAITTLSAVAAVTERVRLGTATLIAPLRHTMWLAIAWATLDQLSQGRTILTMSVGGGLTEEGSRVTKQEYEVIGLPFHRRGKLLEEQIDLLRRLWSGEAVSYAGEFHRLLDLRFELLPAQRPSPPLWIANNPHFYGVPETIVERMVRRVARLADGWMTVGAHPGQFRKLWERICRLAGDYKRDPRRIETAYQMTLTIGDDRIDAGRQAVEYINRYYHTQLQSVDESPWGGTDPFGTPEDCARTIRALRDAGVETFVLRFAAADQLGQMRRFVREVMPLLERGYSARPA
jgi:alkanesulfonate monooxygenase SsuD/methylene tetrahydromethanopterin reductase-like flavin-dependent oxidoreductase (luciferase family)